MRPFFFLQLVHQNGLRDHLVAVEFTSKSSEGRIDGTSTKTKDKMKCGLLGDVVVESLKR